MEWDSRHETIGTSASPVCPGATDYRKLYTAPPVGRQIRVGTWFRTRLECRPVAEVKGRSYYEIRIYMRGTLMDRLVVDFEHGSFVLQVSKGRAVFDNFVVRELVREEAPGGEKKQTGAGS
jgi:hypothetical protein